MLYKLCILKVHVKDMVVILNDYKYKAFQNVHIAQYMFYW